jgi:hypothetical protein
MAILGATALTLADWASRFGDDQTLADIVELLSQTNEMLTDMLWIQGNQPTGNITTVRTGLPSATWRLLNYGVQPTKSTTAQITDTCGMLETYAEADKALVDLNGNTAEFRLSETQAFLEGMSQQMAQAIIYGNQAVNPERITGFAPRFSTVSTGTALNAANVVDAGGTGSNNTSIWIVVWGPRTVAGIFPKGSKAGLAHRDLGEQTKNFSDGSLMQVYRDHFRWDAGLMVRDWRYVVRICNIDVTQLSGGSAASFVNLLIRAVNRLPTTAASMTGTQRSDTPRVGDSMGRMAIYCNRTVRTYLDLQAVNKSNVLLAISEWDGMSVTTFRGAPVRTTDAILNTEARVV